MFGNGGAASTAITMSNEGFDILKKTQKNHLNLFVKNENQLKIYKLKGNDVGFENILNQLKIHLDHIKMQY